MAALNQPEPFITARIHDQGGKPGVTGLCIGYERNSWRASQLADHAIEWLPEFVLKHSEAIDLNSGNAVKLIRHAARKVYESKKFENRGEFGELFLHLAIRQVFKSQPAISKLYYKSALNDTVKGFDAVHVVGNPGNLELWLGESKFYSDIGAAIRDVVDELKKHTEIEYLRDEFLLIKGKIDPNWPHAAELDQLLSSNTSLDVIFSKACVPVLLTYDTRCALSSPEANATT
ncbi:MAG TPA: DUF1837 domain-containing protein [Lacunisphaera sp.]|nr:DUF1837 domain-containing protein [Lacunisphaera sp.]